VESRQLNAEGGTTTPLGGSVSVDLKVGDGVVYNNILRHWDRLRLPQQRTETGTTGQDAGE
jgi:hypothetical protein